MRLTGERTKLALGLLAGVLVLASCSGSGQKAGGGNELHILVSANKDKPTQQAAWFKQLTADFKAETGATLSIETYGSAEEEQKKIQTSMVSGTGPDLYQLGTTFTPVAYATGGFQTLSEDDWKQIGGRERFVPQTLAMSGPDKEHQIGVPLTSRPYGMVYNTELFAAAGISRPPVTWDELLADAQKLNAPGKGVYGLAVDYADGFDPWKYIWTLSEQGGGSLVSQDLKRSQLKSPPVIKAVQSYFDLLTKYKVVNPASVSWKGAQATGAFAAGKAAILPMVAPSVVTTLDSSAMKGKYAFAPLPLVPFGMSQRPPEGKAAGTIVSGDNAGIASYSKSRDLALKYLGLVTSKERQLQYAKTFGDIPTNAEAAKAYTSSVPLIAAFGKAGTAAVPTAFTGGWADVQLGLTNVVTQSLPDLANGGYDQAKVEQLLGTADAAVQKSLDRQK